MKVSRISLLTALAVIISFVALILTIITSQFSCLSPVSGRAVTYEGDIRITIDGSDAGVSKTPVSLYGLKPFAQLSYSLTVPEYVIAGDAAAIRMNSAKFNVFLDGVLLYSYIPDASESGRPEYGYGTTFYIPLADDAAGKELRIDAIEAATNGGIRLAYVEFGDFASMEVETLFMEIEPVIVSFMIVFMACIAFITCFFSRETDTRRSLISSACLPSGIPAPARRWPSGQTGWRAPGSARPRADCGRYRRQRRPAPPDRRAAEAAQRRDPAGQRPAGGCERNVVSYVWFLSPASGDCPLPRRNHVFFHIYAATGKSILLLLFTNAVGYCII